MPPAPSPSTADTRIAHPEIPQIIMLIDAINRLVVRSVYGAGFRAPPRQAAEMIFGKSIAVVEFQAAKSPHALLHESSPPGYRSSLDKLDSPQFGATSRNLAQFRAIVSKVVFLR